MREQVRMPLEPHRAHPDHRLTVVWSQPPMLKRTSVERWFSRYLRALVLGALAAVGYASTVAVGGAVLAESLLRPPRRELAPADRERARAVARRTGSHVSDETVRAADSAVLRGWWFVPAARGRGAVIVLHGHTDNRAATLGLVELLLSDGYRVLAPDARAHGSSGGELATYGVLERGDLRMWADWAQRQFPDQCIFGAGASMGGAILIETLPDVPFCAAVADSTFADLLSLGRWRIGTSVHLPDALHGLVAGPFVAAASWYTRGRHGVALDGASPLTRLARARVPLLVIHGTGDRHVPPGDARMLAEANPRFVTLWLVPGAAHTRTWAAAPREYPARVLAFLAAHQ
jgi:alpha-beta hydrolase superfamily lysophospholipase